MREEAQVIQLSSRLPSRRVVDEALVPLADWTDYRMSPTQVDVGRLQDLAEAAAARFTGPKFPAAYLEAVTSLVVLNVRNARAVADEEGRVTVFSWDSRGRFEFVFFLQRSWLRK